MIDLSLERWFALDGKQGELKNTAEFQKFLNENRETIWLQTTNDSIENLPKGCKVFKLEEWCLPFNNQLVPSKCLEVIKQLDQLYQLIIGNLKKVPELPFSSFSIPEVDTIPLGMVSCFQLIERLFTKEIKTKKRPSKITPMQNRKFFPLSPFIPWIVKHKANIPLWDDQNVQPEVCEMTLKEILSLPKDILLLDHVVVLRVIDYPKEHFPTQIEKLKINSYGLENLPLDVFRRLFNDTLLESGDKILDKIYIIHRYPSVSTKNLLTFILPKGNEFKLEFFVKKELWISSTIYLSHFYQTWKESRKNAKKFQHSYDLFQLILFCFHLENIKKDEYVNFFELSVFENCS